MKILGISRSLVYSPNMAGNDAAIYIAVLDELKAMGHEVKSIQETMMEDFDYTPYDRVVTMSRNIKSVERLINKFQEESDKEGIDQTPKFINSLKGISVCSVKALMAVQMLKIGIPQPHFCCRDGENPIFYHGDWEEKHYLPVWVKNTTSCATEADDTIFCETDRACEKAFQKFEKRKMSASFIQEHKAGDLIKFYGVEGTSFFRWNYASRGHSKFGHEKHNGPEMGFRFDPEVVHAYADKLAKAADIPIYGGDVIIDSFGEPWFIDFNDFPSFSSCVDEAARAIAQRVVS